MLQKTNIANGKLNCYKQSSEQITFSIKIERDFFVSNSNQSSHKRECQHLHTFIQNALTETEKSNILQTNMI